MHRDNERLIADPCVDVLTFHFSKRHRCEWLFAGFGFSCVLGSERTEGDSQLRLIQAILRQVRSDIFDKFCDLNKPQLTVTFSRSEEHTSELQSPMYLV